MDTLRTQRARFLTDVYKQLRATVELEERLKLIHRISEILAKENSSKVFEVHEIFIICRQC